MSRGGRFFPTVNDDDVDDNKDNIFRHHGIVYPAAAVVVQVVVLVIDSISMAPRIRARNSAAVHSPDKTLPSSVTNGRDGIDGIDGIDVPG